MATAALMLAALPVPPAADAATYYWDTTTTGLWGDGANWSDRSGIAGLTGTVPLATDWAVFNQVTVNGNETVQLGGATSILGMIFANTGTTTIQSSSTTSQTLTLGTGGIFIGSGAGAVTIGNATNAATLTASGAQVWTNASANALTLVQQVNLGGNSLTVNGTTTLTGGVTSGGSLTVGGGTLTLNAASAFSGTTTINGGSLTIGTTGSLTGTSTLSLANGALNYNPTSGTLSFATGGTTLGSGAASVTAAAGGTVNVGAITRSAGGVLTVGSTGSVITSATNSNSIVGPWAFFGSGTSTRYAVGNGASAITGLAVTPAAANTVTSTAGTVNANVNATGTLGASANVNTLQYSGGAGTLTTSTAFTTRGILNTGTGILTVAGAVTAGSGGLVVNAAGFGITFNSALAALTGTQELVFTGGSPIATGTLNAAFVTGIATTPLIKSGGNTLTITTTGAVAAISGAVPITVSGGTLLIAGSNNATVNRLGTGAITLNAAGAPTLTAGLGGAGDTFPNALNVTGGVGTAIVQTTSGGHTWSGAIAFQPGTTSGTTLRFVNTNGSASTMTISGAVSGVGNLAFNGTGNGSPFTLSNASINNTGTINLLSSNAAGNLTVSGTIGPNVTGINVTPSAAATMTLSGTNTFNGPVTISGGGTLSFNSINSIGAGSGSALGQPTSAAAGTIFLGGSGRLNYTGGTASSDRLIVMTGSGTIENTSGTAGSTLTLSGGITGNNTALTLRGARNITASGVMSLGSGTLVKTDAGVATLTGANLFSGNVTVAQGTLSVNSIADSGTSALGTGTLLTLGQTNTNPSATLIVTGSAANSTTRALTIVGSTLGTAATQTIQNDSSGALTLGGTFTYTAGTETMNFQLQGSGNGVLNSLISSDTTGTPALALTKSGAGTWTLSQNNVYQGATAVNQGTLVINGSPTGTTGYSVSGTAGNNATLAGTGTLATPVTLGVGTAFTGAAMNPGTVGGAGTLTINAGLTTNAFSRLNFDLNTATTAGGGVNDLVTTNTLPVLSGVTQVNVNALSPLTTGGAYTLISGYTGTIANPSNLEVGVVTGDPGRSLLGFVNNDGSLQVVTGGATPTTAFWANNQATATWNSVNLATATTNWNTAATGGVDTQALPGATTTVRFSTTSPTPSTTTTTLGRDFSIAGLVFESSQGSTPIGIGGANTLTVGTGGITVSGGVPTITAGLALGGAQSWTNNTANPLTVAAVANGANTVTVLGSGSFAQTGAWGAGSGGLTAGPSFTGTLTLNQANTFTGAVTVNSGTVVAAANAGALGAGALTLAGGSLRLSNDSGTGLALNRNTTVSGNATIVSDVTASGAANTYTLGTLAIGAQTLTVAGGANVTSGTAGVTFGAVTLSGAPTFTVNNPSGGGSTLLTLGAITGTNVLTTFNGTGNAAVTGVIGTGTGGVTKSGAGTLTLSGANTYTGTTTLSAGTLRATTSAQALGTGAATLSLGGGTLELANDTGLSFSRNTTVTANSAITADRLASAATTTTHTLGTLSIGAQTLTINRGANITGTATGGVTFGAATLTGAATFSPQTNALLTFSSTTALGGNLLTKSGAGSLTLTGVVSGSTAVGTTSMSISDGVLTASGANTFTGDIAVSGSGVFAMAGNTYTTTAPYGTVTGGTAYKQLLLTNGGTFRLTSGSFNNTAPSSTNIAAGIIFNIGTGGATFDIASGATLIIDDGTGTGTGTGASQLQGSGTITKTGLGIFQQDDSTGFTGAMIIAEGTFQPASANAGGATSAGTTIQSGAQYNVNGVTMTTQEPLTINGTGLLSAPAGALTNASTTNATWVGPITLGSAATIGSSNSGALTLSSTATVNAAGNPLTFRISGSGRIFTEGVISGTSSVILNGTGAGDYVPKADHTYSGGTTLLAGPVAVDRDSTGPAGAPTAGAFGTGTLTIAGGQLRAGTGANRTVGNPVTLSGDVAFSTTTVEKSLTFSGPVTLTGGNRTLTANAGTTVAGIATIFSGAIGEAGGGLGLTKAGTGNLILGGANTYTGATGATGGLLMVTGSLANNSGLSLVPAAAGGAVFSFINNAANTPANFGSLTLGSATGTSFLGLDLGTSSDTIATSTAATANNSIRFHLNAATGFGAGTYNLVSAASGLTAGGATYGLGTVPGGYTYSFTTTDSLVQLTATATGGGSLYWRGNLNNSWATLSDTNTTNWTTDAAGTTVSASTPGAADTVVFSALNATGPAVTTTLDNPFRVNDLQFLSAPAGVSAVTINAGFNPVTLSPGTLTVAPASATAGLTLAQGAGAVTIAAPLTLGAPQTWTVDSSTPASGTASSLTVSGAISGSAANAITFTTAAGATPIILSAASTYAGDSTVSASTIVQGGVANAFSPNTGWTVNGTLNTGAFNQSTGSLEGGTGIVQNGSGTNATLTIGSDNVASATFGGTIQNGSTGTLGLIKAGTGIQTLSGMNTYTGATIVNGGTLRAGSTSALGGGSALTVTTPGVLDLGGFNNTVASLAASTGTITDGSPPGSGGILQITGNTTTAIAATVTGSVGFQYQNGNGSNALFSNASNTYSGGTYLGLGTSLARYTPAASTTVGNGAGVSLTAGIFGTGPIYLGRTTSDQGQIYLSSGTVTINNPITYNSILGSDVVGGIRLQTSNDGVFNGVQTAGLSAISIGAYGAAGIVTINGRLTGSGLFSGTIQNSGSNLGAGYVIGTSAGLIIGASNNNIATVILKNPSSNNNYSGDTWVTPKGVLRTDIANQLPTGAGTGNLYLDGTFNLQGTNQATGGLSGTGTIDAVSGGPTLTIGGNNATGLAFSGIIRNTAGTLTLTKIGSGTQTLSGASTFAGAVNVNGGLVAFATSPATSGPLGNSTVVNLNGGGLSYTASGTNALNRAIAIGAGNGTIDVASSTGTLTVLGATVTSTGGSLVKTGPGNAAITGTTTLNGGLAGVVVSGGTLQAGFGTAGIGSLSVGGSGSLAFQNGVIEALTLGSTGTVLTLANGARLGFELDGTASDSITVPTGGGVALSGGFTFDFINTGAGISAATYTLLTAPAGSALNTFTYTLGSAPLGYNYSFLTSDTQVLLQTAAYSPIYWTGATDGSWATAANFATDAAGTVPAGRVPLANETVIFNATNAVGPTVATTLDGSLTVDSLQFNGVGTPAATSVTIAQGTGGTLTLTPASASGGIAILTGGGNATISAPLTLDNTLSAGQAWNVVDAGSTLTVSGNVVFGANVAKAGAGTVTLSGANSGAGNLSLNSGRLNLNSAGALGTGTLSIAAGTTLDNTSGGAVTLTGNGPVNINGDFTFTGSSSLGLGSGAVTLSGNPIVTVSAGSLSLAGAISGTSGLTKAGAGSLTLNGARSFSGSLTVSGGTLTLGGTSTGSGTVTLAGASLNLGHSGALGTGAFVITGGTLDNTSGGVLTNANNNPLTINGGFTFTGTDDLNLGTGAIGLTTSPTVTVSAKTLTLAGGITGGGFGITKSGPGTLTLAGTNGYTGNTVVAAGTLNLTGALTGNGSTAAGSTLRFGPNAGVSIVNLAGDVSNYYTFLGAQASGSVAVYNQTGGTASYTATSIANNTALVSSAAGGFGALNITGGTTNVLGRFILNSNGTAVGYVGGSGVLNLRGEWGMIVYGNANTSGSLTIGPGGVVDRTGASQRFGIFMEQAGQYGVMNIAGGSFVTTTQPVQFGNGNGGTNNVGFLNLAQGTLQMGTNVSQSVGTSTGQVAYLNFAGGTLQATAALTAAFPTTVTGQTVVATMFGPIDNAATVGNSSQNFTGGLTVDSNGFAVTIGNPLVAPAGFGITQANITIPSSGNSGYAGAPMVRFAAPAAAGGVPASGYALIGGGQVTGIVITNPGTYAAGETPQITLTGGGGSIAAFNTTALATANTSAGLTKTGAGTLTLGSATSTFSGPVVVNAGTIQASGTGTLANIGSPSAFGVGNNASDATNAASVVLNGGTWGIINSGAPVTTNRLFTVTQNGAALVTDNGTAANVITFGNPAPIAYTGSGPRTLTLGGSHAGGTNANTFAPQITDAGSGVVSVTKSGATNWQLTNAANSYTGGTTIQQGILGFTSGALAPTGNITFAGNSTLQWATGNTEDVSGRLVMTNGVAATLDTSGNAVSLASAIGNASSGSLVKAGTGTLTLTAANTYTGTSTIAAGTLNLGAAETPGTSGPLGNQAAAAAGTILMTGGTLQFSAVNTNDYSGRFSTLGSQTWNIDTNSQSVTFASALQGATSTLTKSGAGTLTLSGANTYAGNTIVNGGTLNITGGITGNTTTTRLDYGTTAGTTIVNHSGSLTAWVTRGADVAGAVSVFNQTAGTVTIVPTNAADNQWVARTGYGALNITGGTFNTGRFDGVAPGGTNGVAVMYVGGTGTLNQTVGDWFVPIRTNGTMSLSIGPGGTFARQNAVTSPFSITGLDGTNSYGVFNVAGGTVDLGASRGLNFSSGFSPGTGNVGFLNAAGGTLSMGANIGVGNAAGSTSAFINFAGATVRANAALSAVIPASTANYTFRSTVFGPITNNNNASTAFNAQVGPSSNFAGGLVVDTNSFSVTFSNPMLGADGTVGVTQADVTIPSTGNSGYAAAPMVRFAAPAAAGGVPASGYALIGGGQVTGIVITNPGTYAAGETPQITLTGGGGSIAAFNTTALATANTSAGLTKTGAGTLTLGSATSTFSGPVVVNAGTVQASGTGTLANIGSPSAFGVGNNASDATNAASVVLNGGTWGIINSGAPVTTNRLFTVTQNGASLVTDNGTAANVITFGNPAPIAYTGSGPRTLTLGGSHAGGTNANTFAPQITDAGSGVVSVTKSGATNWQLTNAANSYTGGTTIQQGILGFTSGALAPTGTIAFTGNSTLQWATGNTDDVSGRLLMTNGVAATLDTSGNAVTLASAIGNASSGSLAKAGTGTLTLTAANTYTGTSTIAAGTLALGAPETPGTAGPLGNQAAAAAGTILMTGGTLQFSAVNTNDYSGRFSTAGSQTWNIDTNSQSVTFATSLQGATSGLGKFGTGTLTLSGANTYTGATTINAGTVAISGSGTLGSASALTMAGGGLDLGATSQTVGAVSVTAAAASGDTIRNGSLTGTSYVASNITGNAIISANLLGTGTMAKSGGGTMTLSGTNSYSGSTTITAGTLVIAGATNSGAGNVTVGSASTGFLTIATGGALTTTGTLSLGAGVVGNGLTVQTGGSISAGLINNPWGTSYTIDGSLTSTGTWTVSTQRTTDTFTGSGTITAAALTLGNASTGVNYTGSGTINLAGALTIASNSGTGNASYTQSSGLLNAASILLGDTVTNTSGSRTFNLSGGRVNVGSGGIASTGTTTATRTVNLGAGTLGASADWSGSLAMSLTSASPGLTIHTLDSVDGTTGRTVTLSGILSGAGGLTKAGAGSLILSNANTFSGTTAVGGGTLVLTNNLALQNSILSTTGAGTITIDAGMTTPTLGGLSGATGDLATLISSGYGSVTSLTLNPGSGATATYGGVIANGAAAMALTKTGAGTQILAGANTYTGTTTINQGTLKLTGSAVLGGLSGSTTDANNIVFGQNLNSGVLEFETAANLGPADQIRFRNTAGGTDGLGGALVYVGGSNETLSKTIQCDTSIGIRIESNSTGGSLTVNGPFSQTNRTIYLGGSGTGNNTLASVFAGTGGLTKRGAGTWVVTVANTYSGSTTIDQGTLAFAANQTMTGGLVFGAANGATNNGGLDLSSANASFSSLLVRTNSATANTVTVGSGKTLTVTGAFTLGYDAGGGTGATRSNLTVSGAGAMSLTGTTVTIGTNQAATNAAYWNDATLDVTGLSNFTTNVTTFNVGVGTTTQGPGTLLLSNTANTIVATTLTAGDTVGSNGRGTGRIQLGAGTNIIQVDTLNIGRGKNSGPGMVEFLAKTAGSPGTVTITNRAGTGAANITVGDNNGTATAGGAIGTLDLRGHVANVTGGTLIAGRNNMGSGTGSVTSDVFFDAGTFTVDTITMAQKTGSGTGGVTATLNVGGGNFTVNASGSFTLGSQATAGTATASLNLTGGTFTSNVDILDGGGAATSVINLSGGTLDMTGRNIGSGTNVIDTLTFASGTLRNVGQINGGAALSKTSLGTLAMTGTSSYTGQTILQAGTLSFDSIANVGGGASALGAPATSGTGTIAVGAAATGATLQYLGGTAASTDRVVDLAGTTGGATLDSSGAAPIAFLSNLTASGAGSKTLTLAGTNIGANILAGVIPDNSPTNVTSLAKTGAGRWVLSGVNTYTGGTTVSGGTLALSGVGTLGGGPVLVAGGTLDLGGVASSNVINFQSGGLANAAQATLTNVLGGGTLNTNGLTLGGTVNVTGTLDGTGLVGMITGSGLVAPGNSPGILTASQLDFSGGIDQAFELTTANAYPAWNDAADSLNDLLRLTNASPFNGTAASTINSFEIYLNVASLTGTEKFFGGVFTDSGVDPFTGLNNATYNYYVKGDGGGTIAYKDAMYYTLAQYNTNNSTAWTVTMGTERVPSANFAGGPVENGYVQMLAVPEPSSCVLLLVGVLALGGHRLTRRARRC